VWIFNIFYNGFIQADRSKESTRLREQQITEHIELLRRLDELEKKLPGK
jgi:hypothetical protein